MGGKEADVKHPITNKQKGVALHEFCPSSPPHDKIILLLWCFRKSRSLIGQKGRNTKCCRALDSAALFPTVALQQNETKHIQNVIIL